MTQRSLFGEEPVRADKPARRARGAGGWEMTDHACRNCMGRLLRRVSASGRAVHRCAECGANAVGEHEALCWCGVEVRGHGRTFECFRNLAVTDTAPQEVMVRERRIVKVPERAPGRKSNPVRIEGVG